MKLAAQASGVPFTFLAAIAYHESGYDPTKKGKKLSTGGQAQGLFQLTPVYREHYNVKNAFDPVEASRKAAEGIAWLASRFKYDWSDVAAAYFMGETGLNKAKAAGKLPDEVQRYVDSVRANRAWLQRQTWERAEKLRSAAKSDTSQQVLDLSEGALQRINRGFLALESANRDWVPLARVLTPWREWYTPTRGAAALDVDMARDPVLVRWWVEYLQAYDRAPVVTGDVPPPDEIQPSLWETFKRDAGRILDEATKEWVNAIAKRSPIEITVSDPARYDPAFNPLTALLLMAGLLLYVQHRRERS